MELSPRERDKLKTIAAGRSWKRASAASSV